MAEVGTRRICTAGSNTARRIPSPIKGFLFLLRLGAVFDEAFLLLVGIDLEVPVAPTAAASRLSLLSAHADR